MDFSSLKGKISFSRKKTLVVKYYELEGKVLFFLFKPLHHASPPSLEYFWEKELREGENLKEVLPSLLETLTRKVGGKVGRIVWVVPERYVVLRRLALPRLPPKELQSAIVLNVKKTLPCRLDELFYAYKTFSLSGTNKTEVVFYGIMREYVDRFVPPPLRSKVVFWPQDLAIREIVLISFPEKVGDTFSVVYEDEGIMRILLSDAFANVLFKIVSSPSNIGSELLLISEYYKKTYRVGKEEIPTLSLVESEVPGAVSCDFDNLKATLRLEDSWPLLPTLVAFGTMLGLGVNRFPGIRAEEKVEKAKKERIKLTGFSLEQLYFLFEQIPVGVIGGIAGAILIASVAIYTTAYLRYKKAYAEFKKVSRKLPKDVFSNPMEVSMKQIKKKRESLEKEIDLLTAYVENRKKLSNVLEIIDERFSHGFWLKLPFSISLDISSGKMSLVLTGGVYLNDEDEEVKALEELVKNLKADLKDYFKNIELVFLRREKSGGREYLAFSLRCV